ncbi:hypothetical protein ABZ208_13925 [Streptomyces sp. NPDC006208]|uniref:hypothetical protein n=1 Tax=Streptomyces sp. NPDC006208 TaxID=3156734 RepID=UPI0033B6728A
MTDFNPGRDEVEDVAAMKREGDLSRFLRQQIRDGQARRDKPTAAPKPAPPPGYQPGAWPSGTGPPGPLKAQPPGAWADALDRFRAGEGADRDPCHCGGCDTTDNDTEENQ